MGNPTTTALRLLAHFWLEEVTPADLPALAAVPALAEALPDSDSEGLANLGAEYQRLFGFNLPPYESLFVDPSGMLMAAVTERVQTLYRAGGWQSPHSTRSGAPDHLGLELTALANWRAAGRTDFATAILTEHLAVWLPPFVLSLRRLSPPPFYATLGDLTLALVLSLLDELAVSDLPTNSSTKGLLDLTADISLRQIIAALLPPCQAGLFLTRQDIAAISHRLDLPPTMGERGRMLDGLFRQAGQYDLLPRLFEELTRQLVEAEAKYRQISAEYPAWHPYAGLWIGRLRDTQQTLAELAELADAEAVRSPAPPPSAKYG